MASLGSFGTPREAADDTFSYFGVELRVHPDISDVAILELFSGLAEMAVEDPDAADASVATRMIGMVHQTGALLVHPDDLDEFRRLVRVNRQTIEDLSTLAAQLLGALAERPTRLPSDFSDGQRPTATRSTDDLSSRALAAEQDRPDRQVAVMRRLREARPA